MVKRIGVVVAMASEAQVIIAELFGGSEEITEQVPYRFTSREVEIGIVVSGIGKVNAAAATARLILEFAPTEVVVVGLAGSLSDDLSVGDIVIAEKVVQYDFDLRPLEPKVGQLPGRDSPYLRCDEEATTIWRKIADELCREDNSSSRRVLLGAVATGDRIVSSRVEREAISTSFPEALCVEMESGAVAQVCQGSKVPCAVVRIISDFADDTFTVKEITRYLSHEGSRLIERLISSLNGV